MLSLNGYRPGSDLPWHCLTFFPLQQGQGSLLPALANLVLKSASIDFFVVESLSEMINLHSKRIIQALPVTT
jgi:hypothetical protein